MRKRSDDMKEGTIHKTNSFGDVKIISYESKDSVLVMFLRSGFCKKFQAGHIRMGSIRDNMQPTVFGVGYLGEGRFLPSYKYKHSEAYKCWRAMMARCYCRSYHEKYPTYKDCEVCEDWQNFAEWHEANAPDSSISSWHLDKDIRIDDNKIYSPEACSFVSAHENVSKAMGCHGRVVELISPTGVLHKVSNIEKFCKGKSITPQGISMLINRKSERYKGWRVISVRYN